MKRLILILSFLFASAESSLASSACGASTVERLLSHDDGDTEAKISCSLTLRPTDHVKKTIILEGSRASGVRIDCQGGVIDGSNNKNKLSIIIRSIRVKVGVWDIPENVSVENCRIIGRITITGWDTATDRTSSHRQGHTERARGAAPRNVLLSRLNFSGMGRTLLNIRPGVTRVTVINSEFGGNSQGTAIYLDAESGFHRILYNVFDVKTVGREQIAVDGSSDNAIVGNVFHRLTNGGIFLYRNCGEAGIVRHQSPTRNVISFNRFVGVANEAPAIWLGSRNKKKPSFCGDDKGYDFGSSKYDESFASGNSVFENRFGKEIRNKIVDDDEDNRILP